jgi:hypothetical protein
MVTFTAPGRNHFIIQWMAKQGPAEWHGVAERWRWQDGIEPLIWIIRQEYCDRATAASLFWISEPFFYMLDDVNADHEIADLEREIIFRWNSGQYKTKRFEFTHDYLEGAHETWTALSRTRTGVEIPDSLGEPISGREAYPVFIDGLPPEIDVAWYNANNACPPDWFLERYQLTWDGEKIQGTPALLTPKAPIKVKKEVPKMTPEQVRDFNRQTHNYSARAEIIQGTLGLTMRNLRYKIEADEEQNTGKFGKLFGKR